MIVRMQTLISTSINATNSEFESHNTKINDMTITETAVWKSPSSGSSSISADYFLIYIRLLSKVFFKES
jgi:hypothetical protein